MTQGIASILSTSADTARLRLQAGNGEQVDNEIMQQFEALFLQQMLKSMRTASLAEGLFQSDQSEFYRDMYDQQIATELASKELLGIAQVINRQLGKVPTDQGNVYRETNIYGEAMLLDRDKMTTVDKEYSDKSSVDISRLSNFIEDLSVSIQEQPKVEYQAIEKSKPLAFIPETPNEFVDTAYHFAHAPAEKLGVDPKVLVAIAALETGWGNHVPKDDNGSSNNYFGIKADSRWQGDQVNSKTLEFESGAFNEVKQPFRAYNTMKEPFNDYADFLLSNDRYAYALEFANDTKRFLTEIQNAGYATDPNYANKIMNVLGNKAFSLR